MKKISKITRRQIYHARHILRENSPLTYFYLKLLNIFRIERDVRLMLSKRPVVVRSATPDLRVALANLGREFDILAESHPHEGDALVIDAGGYIGTAAVALSRIYPGCTIVTIEPSSKNFATLQKNIAGIDNIRPVKAALVAEHGKGRIDLMSRGNGEWGFTTIQEPDDHATTFLERVETVTVEDILKRFGYERAHVLKMDIEGGEHAFMSGPNDWLDKVDIFLVELHERIIAGCTDSFERCNLERTIVRQGIGKLISIRKPDEVGKEACVA